MLDVVRKYKLMPEKIYSEKNVSQMMAFWLKSCFMTLHTKQDCQQELVLLTLITVTIGLHTHLCPCCFNLLESQRKPVFYSSRQSNMNYFLWAGFVGSKIFASAEDSIKTQGMCQGNGAAPAGWMVDSIAMIQAHKQKGHGAHLWCPIINKTIHLAGTLFVEDTNLEHLDLNKME